MSDTWKVTLPDGSTHLFDDATLAELEAMEQASGQSWAAFNPWRSVAAARAFYGWALLRAGHSDEDAKAAVAALTARQIKDVFDLVPDTLPAMYADGLPDPNPDAVPTSS